ncbi:MAG TPA: cytochrome c maturation protein CcmE [Sphingomicrobium sp.]|nr:cytochrome c maturation protein CcmE [Sphingomicrobium sp.]
MKPKSQRLVLVGAALVALLAAVLLAMWGLREKASYFYTPSELDRAAVGKAIRLGGMVEQGSLVRNDALTVQFAVTDGKDKVTVVYRGIPPELFREGSGVVAEGKLLPQGLFVADNILAKHDERYMPPQLGNIAAEHEAGKTLDK